MAKVQPSENTLYYTLSFLSAFSASNYIMSDHSPPHGQGRDLFSLIVDFFVWTEEAFK